VTSSLLPSTSLGAVLGSAWTVVLSFWVVVVILAMYLQEHQQTLIQDVRKFLSHLNPFTNLLVKK
jgi:Na+-driven multidrug efflux pump